MLQSELEYLIKVGKQFNLNQHQLQLKKMKLIIAMMVVVIKS
jgi:hypothetical protein